MNINILLILVFCIIVISLLILIFYFSLNNKINYIVIRIDEADNRIGSNLKEKYDLLDRSISLIKEKVKDENILKEVVKLRSRKVSNFTLNQILNEAYNEFNQIISKNKELNKSNEIMKINKQLALIDNELSTLLEYYNGNVYYYNKLLKKFPTSIVSKIKKYNIKDFFNSNNDKND